VLAERMDEEARLREALLQRHAPTTPAGGDGAAGRRVNRWDRSGHPRQQADHGGHRPGDCRRESEPDAPAARRADSRWDSGGGPAARDRDRAGRRDERDGRGSGAGWERERARARQDSSREAAAAREERELERELAPPVQWDALLSSDGLAELDALLFPPGAFIRASSSLHREFGEFFERYAKFRKKELERAQAARAPAREDPAAADGACAGTGRGGAAAGALAGPHFHRKLAEFRSEMPEEYDQRYRINFAVVPPRAHVPPTRVLGDEEVKEAKRALLLFEDFRQRKSIAKIRKMREDQRTLPIYAFRDEIIAAVRREQVVLIAGDTGCGKSTQVPQYLVQAGFDRVACTQPRRISTMSLCARVATETLNEHGSQVAYQIRFDSNRSERTKILFLTEGLLLRQLSADPLLEQYSVIIIDEVHERHLTGDLLLAVLRSLIAQRADLRVVLMSATINTRMFADYFGATIIKVPGRLYPIALEYIPVDFDADGRQAAPQECGKGVAGRKTAGIATAKLAGAKPKPFDAKPYLRLLQRIDDEYPKAERGDMLVFLSGMNEITALADALREYVAESRRWIVLKLHSSLAMDEQDRVFDLAPDGVRKCILSTNIAETSVTIDGIRFVADSGKVKEMDYESDSAVHSLQEFWISKASANQRKGRAGRTGPGVCFRFYSQQQFEALLDFTVPEIQRVPLAATALQIKCMELGDPREFPWVEAPPAAHVTEAMARLRSLQALSTDADEEVLPLGAVLSALPVDLAIGKLLIFSTIFGLEDELMTMAAGLSIQSLFTRVDPGSAESTSRQKFVSEEGDPFTVLNVYDEWIRVKAAKENTKKWSKRHGVEEQRLYEMTRLKEQFADLLKSAGLLQVETLTQARNRVARSNPDRSWKRKQLKKLQKERDLSKKTRVLDLDGGGAGAEPPEDTGPDSAAAQDEGEVDLKALDFELSHDLGAMSDVCSRDLTLRQVNLAKLALAASLHPNVALADPGNVNRRIDEAVFVTQRKPLTAMHPTSVFGSSPSLIGPTDLVLYSQLLETTKAWVMNATRCPLLVTALLCGNSIDTNRACTRLLVDNWLEIHVQSGKLGEKMLYVTQQLRHALACCLASRLATCSHSTVAEAAEKAVQAGRDDDGAHGGGGGGELGQAADEDLPELLASLREEVKRKSFVRELELQTKLADLLELDVKHSASVCARSKVLWQLLHPEARSLGRGSEAMHRAMQEARTAVGAEGQIDEEQLERLKGGVRVCPGVRFASLFDGPVRAGGFTSLLQHNTACSVCQKPMLVTLEQLLAHEEQCTGLLATPPESLVMRPNDQPPAASSASHAGGGDTRAGAARAPGGVGTHADMHPPSELSAEQHSLDAHQHAHQRLVRPRVHDFSLPPAVRDASSGVSRDGWEQAPHAQGLAQAGSAGGHVAPGGEARRGEAFAAARAREADAAAAAEAQAVAEAQATAQAAAAEEEAAAGEGRIVHATCRVWPCCLGVCVSVCSGVFLYVEGRGARHSCRKPWWCWYCKCGGIGRGGRGGQRERKERKKRERAEAKGSDMPC